MALSEYERRVLDEIEAELRVRPEHRCPLGAVVGLLVFSALVAAGLIVLAVLALPPAPAAVMASLFGVAVGYLGGVTWCRRHRGRAQR
jgi:tetrahydromethanopterin S-methyltransferase subunit E